jgi:Surfeit locus protein 6
MAKLDPDNAKSAKDVMDERAAAALKRKREEEDEADFDGPTEKQREGLKLHDRKEKRRKTDKKQSKSDETDDGKANETSTEDQKRRKVEKKAANKQRKQAEKLKAQQKADRRKARKQAAMFSETVDTGNDGDDQNEIVEDDQEMTGTIDIDAKDIAATDRHSTASPSPEITSPIASPHLHSGSSSISSIQPPSIPLPDQSSALRSTTSKLPPLLSESADSSPLTPQQRLEARINSLRAQRKADGPDGHPPRNRQELLESRRRQEEKKRAYKKELQRKAKEEEIRKQEEEIVKRFSPGGSGSLIASPRSPMEPSNNFSFGRVAFGDGTQADSSLSLLLDQRKKKGASDAGTALKAAQNKASRLSGLDETKRADIEQKDMWLNAKKKAHGEHVRDDTSLLKKTLKRQEGEKKKSEKEWQGRVEGVAKSQEARQRKRQENINKRREEKGSGGGKHAKKKGGAGGGKKPKVKRPGFEGSFKTKPSGGKR